MSQPFPPPPEPAPGTPPIVPAYQVPASALPLTYPTSRRPYALSEIICWCIVLLVVAVTATFVAIEERATRNLPESSSQFIIGAKVAVGMHALAPQAAGKFSSELDGLAKSPQDRFRMAIVEGELSGKNEALRRIDAAVQASPTLGDDAATARSLYNDEAVPNDQLTAFHNKWEWFADVAQSCGKGATDPVREKMLRPAYLAAAGDLGLSAAALAGGGVGLILLVLAIVFLATHRLVPAFAAASGGRQIRGYQPLPLPRDRRAYIQAFAWFLGLYFGTALLFGHVLKVPTWVPAVAELVMLPLSLLVVLFWPRLMGGSWSEWRAAMGLHLGRGLFREIGSGIVGYIAGLPVVIVGFLITTLLINLSGAMPSHPIDNVIAHGNWILVLLAFALACIWAPFAEELTFRGAFYAHLRERYGWLFSAAVVGLIFAMVHPQGWTVVPTLASVGFVLASIREWRGSILPCMVAHAMHNFVILCFALLMLH